MKYLIPLFIVGLLLACSSSPTAPEPVDPEIIQLRGAVDSLTCELEKWQDCVYHQRCIVRCLIDAGVDTVLCECGV